MRKIVVLDKTTNGYQYEKSVLASFPDVVFTVSGATDEADIIRDVRDAEVILFTATPITASIIGKLENCRLIIRYGVGYDNVDTAAAAKRGIYVCNAPNYGVVDVAEHALSLLFAVAKKTVKMNERAHNGGWGAGGTPPFLRLSGKTIGFVGFGNIGKAVCKRTNAMEMKALVYDPYISPEILAEYHAEGRTLASLLADADIVTLHLPLCDATRHMFGKECLDEMKKTAILINTSRGPIVNEPELIAALTEKRIAGVGLDVFEDEKNRLDERLLAADNAVLTPHVAWNTDGAVPSLHREVGDNLVRYFKGEKPHSVVNKL